MSIVNIDNIQWPCPLSKDLKQQLLALSHPGKGMPNTNKNMSLPGIYYITKGTGILFITCDNMSSSLGLAIGVNDWTGASSIGNDNKVLLMSLELEPVQHLFFPKQKLELLAKQNLEAFKFLYHCVTTEHPQVFQASLTSLHDREVRIAYSLLSLAQKKSFIKGANMSLKITQAQLSTITGLTRPRINEALKKFEKAQEISMTRGEIHIIDVNALGNRLNQLNTMFSDPRKT
ncbi:hypothetical protein CW745_10595 [Psychromonas sp. psych-6C06]|uniref:Crp/Fnr family transcriptional regulator n=1 Tax=Psychromonas sp. psych-6C06 TaxID=2058089 RepID=UPI000C34A002|nr:Crp/Fnr family transcriptional regulator [Psychromonas sp. psych-6C06]PKF61754.1 hypothetical protein CW745_10595 [Psychromonas sp. psych-6C06]